MLIVEPVIVGPLLAEWETTKAEIGATIERAGASKSAAARTRLRQQVERSLRSFLERLRKFIVLDPACGSGNFLYMALHALKDIEHRVQLEARNDGPPTRVPGPWGRQNVKGIEINAYAAELAPSVGVDWRDPVDAAQRVQRISRPNPEAARNHRVPGRDPRAGRQRAGLAKGGCHSPAIHRFWVTEKCAGN